MTTKMAAVGFAQENKGRFVEELKALLRIPSISTDPERAGDVRGAAEFVAAELKRIGMENVRLIETTSATLQTTQKNKVKNGKYSLDPSTRAWEKEDKK